MRNRAFNSMGLRPKPRQGAIAPCTQNLNFLERGPGDNPFQAIPKNGIWLKVKEEVKRQPEEYMTYFEDWLFASDAEIESYNFFGVAWQKSGFPRNIPLP